MKTNLKHAILALFGLCGGLGAAPIWAEGWRLPNFAAKPAPQTAALDPITPRWALPAPAVRLVDPATQQSNLRPAPRDIAPLLQGPTAIVTGFSGHRYARPLLPDAARQEAMANPDYQTIDLDGISVSLSNIADFGQAPNASEITRALWDALYARQIGQVFGAVLDDADQPNLYLAATSAYGVQIVGRDGNLDGLPDRLRKGRADARYMAGQWGDAAGPRTIWRVDGATGRIEVFANLAPEGAADTAASLGNLAYDAAHDALFVSDLETGLIARFALDGRFLDSFDHGSAARPLMGLEPVAQTSGTAITDPAFDPLEPATWGMAPEARRVWGLAVHQGRLYYSVALGKSPRPELWSVGLIRETGAFAGDARWELTLPDTLPAYEISDIGFDLTGGVVLAQRGPRNLTYDFSQMADVGRAEVLRFVREAPFDDPDTPSIWEALPLPYAVGFAATLSNTTGGIAFGPGYDAQGRLDYAQCRGTLWTTGEVLRGDPGLAEPLSKGGSLLVDGVQAQPAALVRDQNSPPWISYSLDYDRKYPDDMRIGYLGDVVVYGCSGGIPETAATLPPDVTGDPLCTGPSCILLACLVTPSLCDPPKSDQLCAQSTVDVICDDTGGYLAKIDYSGAQMSAIKLTDPSGQITSLPQTKAMAGQFSVPLTGLVAGQVGQINLCSFDPPKDGAPFDCCNTSVAFKLPMDECKPAKVPQ